MRSAFIIDRKRTLRLTLLPAVRAMEEATRTQDYGSLFFFSEAKGQLAEALARTAPGWLEATLPAVTGSEAIDQAIKLARGATRTLRYGVGSNVARIASAWLLQSMMRSSNARSCLLKAVKNAAKSANEPGLPVPGPRRLPVAMSFPSFSASSTACRTRVLIGPAPHPALIRWMPYARPSFLRVFPVEGQWPELAQSPVPAAFTP